MVENWGGGGVDGQRHPRKQNGLHSVNEGAGNQ